VHTYRLTIEYDGTEFRGWQAQKERPTVQQAIESALSVALRTQVRVVGSGRTDAGVHARGQVAHFRSRRSVDTHRLRGALDGLLPKAIAVIAVEAAVEGFHARFDAIRRAYAYQVATEARAIDRLARWRVHPPPDFEIMNAACEPLLGKHDFSAFCIARSETRNRVCAVHRAVWLPEDRAGDWRFVIEADRFLHGMVRAIVGTLVEVGRGRRAPDEVATVLASGDRRLAGPSAPALGLVLERVEYAASREPVAGADR